MPTRIASDRYTSIDYPRMREYRLARTRKMMEEQGIGTLVTFEPWDVRYITGAFVPPAVKWPEGVFVVLPRNGDPHLYIFSPYAIRKEMPWMKEKIWSQIGIPKMVPDVEGWDPWVDRIEKIVRDHGLENELIGVDGCSSELLLHAALQGRGLKMKDAKDCMFQARMIKNVDEIACIRESCAIAEAAFYDMQHAIRPGITELEIMGVGMKKLYSLGADEVFEFVVASGQRTNPIRIDYTDRLVRPGEVVFIDVNGSSFQGYKCCYYRSFVCGKATQEQKDTFYEAKDMMYEAMKGIKAGNTTADICAGFPDSPAYWGYDKWEDSAPFAVGHGIGLSLHEYPFFSRPAMGGYRKLEEGMVIAVETWCGKKDGKFGIRLEENVVVTKDGYDLLTLYPIDELIECND